MDVFIALGIPVLILLIVIGFFQRELQYFRQAEKLKIGDLERLVQRHRSAVMLHFAVLVVLLPILIFSFGEIAISGAILSSGIFLGHVFALSNMSRPIIHSLKMKNESQFQEQEAAEDETFLEEVQASRKRLE
jgi:fatty acid desaturase